MKPALVIVALILLIRLPFLNQAIQGDDVYYLASAVHAQIEPAHPNHVHYIFEGRDVDFRGYPHPPLNAWFLALLIALFGTVREVPFHAAYILFSLLAAFSMWSLAKRFSPHPLWATLLFIATPAFVINGGSFESDVPFVAFWLAGIAAFVAGRLGWSALFLCGAALAAPQSFLLTPILAVYVWLNRRYSRAAWVTALVPIAAALSWQTFEFLTDGRFPALVSAGYQQSYGYLKLMLKVRSAEGLAAHALFLVFPPLLLLLPRPKNRDQVFLYSWIGIFFLSAVVLFFAGAARYLLPMAAPLAILVTIRAKARYLRIGSVPQFLLSLLLATVNYQQQSATRSFSESLPPGKRVWTNAVNGGLRFYPELQGALPLHEDQLVPPGDVVISSELSYPVAYKHPGSVPATTAQLEIRPAIPLRLIGLDTRSGYATSSRGLLPFGISNGLVDRLKVETLVTSLPTEQYVDLSRPDADNQIAAGIYAAEGNPWRWMAKTGTLLLKPPATPTPLQVRLYIPDTSPTRTIALTLDNVQIAAQTFPKPGAYTIATPPKTGSILTLTADKSFSVPTDHRDLSVILTGAGFLDGPSQGK